MDDDLIFHPFEINDYDHRLPLCEIDPDLYFYNSVNLTDAIQCNYYDEKTFCEADFHRGNNQTGGVLSICHLNIRSMKKNLKNFDVYMKTLDYNFSLIGMSETWLQSQTRDLYDLEGYEFVETHRTTKSGGGVGLFINEKYQFYKRTDLCQLDDCMECVTIEIEKHNFEVDKNIIVSVIYRPPNTDTDVFINTLNTFIEKIKPENKYCYLLGDYNINILNHATHHATHHFPIFHMSRFRAAFQCTETSINARNFSYRNKQAFQNVLDETDWSEIYSRHNAQGAFSWFYSRLKNLYNKHFPVQKVKLRYHNRKPWLTDALKQSIRTKNKLYMKYMKIKSAHNESCYKRYRNKLSHLPKIAEKTHVAKIN